ncbi:hypothetical protein QLQ12_18205 [Actinoplanes sp. NEAU-A12]|uniref:Rpn family recombination-promoting nuclease/putative transposase n=1 Tax=Actinoplanes sandaracinus TaxID=3045177 RepID=A0ABT6WLH4_9ACTN|nr:hypothetical protein [Actinoplanes sandaracinus]MDI6100546.1 hypothetical protein [Actinoplanes sandaracinus]
MASKRIVNTSPARFGKVFGIAVPKQVRPGATELNLAEIHADRRNADLVLTGGDRVVHLEFQHRADPAMADRMLIYRSLLRVEPACAGKEIQQHVIVLGKGTSPSQIDESPDLVFTFETHYARDVDPAEALADPLTAPWAILAAARSDAERIARLEEILRAVTSAESESLVRDLTMTTLTFAAITMKREDIERVLREAGMPADMIRDTEFAQELIDEGRVEGLAEGRAEGRLFSTRSNVVRLLRHRGVDEGRTDAIAAALIEQDIDTAAERAAFDDLTELTSLGE